MIDELGNELNKKNRETILCETFFKGPLNFFAEKIALGIWDLNKSFALNGEN